MTDRGQIDGLLRRLYAARLQGDLDAMCKAFADDAVFQIAGAGQVSPVSSRAVGVGEFRPLLAVMIKTFRLRDHVILDLLSTKFFLDYSTRPLHFFGFFGLLATGAGTLIGSALVFKKLVLHKEVMLANGPLLFAATVLILAGIQFLCLGLASEILSRTYYESQGKPIYAIKAIRSHELPSTPTIRQEHGAGG